MNEIKLDDSLHKFKEKVEVKATWPSEYKTFITCFILEIADKKIAIDDSRIDVFNSVQDWKKSFSPWSNTCFRAGTSIRSGAVVGLPGTWVFATNAGSRDRYTFGQSWECDTM